MPEARAGHAASSPQPSQPSHMEHSSPTHRLLEEPISSTVARPGLLLADDEKLAKPLEAKTQQKEVNKKSLDYVMRSGLAGGLAGCAAKTVVAPLDRVKILYQTSNPQFAKYTGHWGGMFIALRDIHRAEGVRGLFRGHSATLLRIFPYAGIKFLAYEQIRAVIIPDQRKETPGRRFTSGSLAGISSVFCTYPLEVIRVRLAFETKKDSRSSLARICRQIYNETAGVRPATAGNATVASVTTVAQAVTPRSGLSNFYRGFAPTILGMIPYAGVSFLTHDTIGDILRQPAFAAYTIMPASGNQEIIAKDGTKQKRRTQLTAPAELVAGAMAGFVSQTASYPLEVIRRRMQVGGAIGDGHRLSIAETARRILLERGFKGFFVGLSIGYIKTVPMAAVSFYVYERGKWLFGI